MRPDAHPMQFWKQNRVPDSRQSWGSIGSNFGEAEFWASRVGKKGPSGYRSRIGIREPKGLGEIKKMEVPVFSFIRSLILHLQILHPHLRLHSLYFSCTFQVRLLLRTYLNLVPHNNILTTSSPSYPPSFEMASGSTLAGINIPDSRDNFLTPPPSSKVTAEKAASRKTRQGTTAKDPPSLSPANHKRTADQSFHDVSSEIIPDSQ